MSQPLRFGTYTEFQSTPGETDHAELIWDMIAVGEHADQLGFDVFCCLEHPWFERFAVMPAPIPFFTALAQRTRNLRFRALCHTLPLHNPMVLAGELALADILLNGRFDIGVGRGHAWLNDPANLVLEENVERFAECLDIIVGTLSNERFSYDGKYYKLDELNVVPRPIQKPHPKIFQVGTSAKWFQRAAENGYGCMLGGPAPTSVFREPAKLYRQLCEQEGTDPYLGWIKAIWLDEDEKRAHADARQAVLNFVSYNVSPIHTLPRTSSEEKDRLRNAGYAFYAEDDFPNTEKLTYEQLIEYGIVFVGTPEKVGNQLMELYDEFHFEELGIISHFGAMQRENAMKTQRLFAKEIMPALRDASSKQAAAVA